MSQNIEVEEEHVDNRSVDDLLQFINGDDGGMLKFCSVIVCLHIFNFLSLSIDQLNFVS